MSRVPSFSSVTPIFAVPVPVVFSTVPAFTSESVPDQSSTWFEYPPLSLLTLNVPVFSISAPLIRIAPSARVSVPSLTSVRLPEDVPAAAARVDRGRRFWGQDRLPGACDDPAAPRQRTVDLDRAGAGERPAADIQRCQFGGCGGVAHFERAARELQGAFARERSNLARAAADLCGRAGRDARAVAAARDSSRPIFRGLPRVVAAQTGPHVSAARFAFFFFAAVVVDVHGHRGGRVGVPGVVGERRAQLVGAVAEERRIDGAAIHVAFQRDALLEARVFPGPRRGRFDFELPARDAWERFRRRAAHCDRARGVGGANASRLPAGGVLSIVTSCTEVVWVLPALSAITVRSWYAPSV